MKSFIASFPAILLKKFQASFHWPIIARFSDRLIHNLAAKIIHGPAEMLYNVKADKDNLAFWNSILVIS